MFYNQYTAWMRELKGFKFTDIREKDIWEALSSEHLGPENLLALLSPLAQNYLEEMAQKAHNLTIRHFGRAVGLYTPLYLANYCTNHCAYCSFSVMNAIARQKLSLVEVEEEGKAIAATGLQHLLLLTGESRQETSPEYLKECTGVLRGYFASLGIEVYPLAEEEYRGLYAAGIDSLTIYQEVYDEDIYRSVHLSGPKRNYLFRLDAPERACRAGIPGINIGALLGLGEWRQEAFFTALHAAYLQKNYPSVELGLSIPRMRPHIGGYEPQFPVADRELVQILLAYRLYLPQVGISLSTREKASFRDALLPLGITRMSAGSVTSVGGHVVAAENGSSQFEIADERSVTEITDMLRSRNYQPVFCDWVDARERRLL